MCNLKIIGKEKFASGEKHGKRNNIYLRFLSNGIQLVIYLYPWREREENIQDQIEGSLVMVEDTVCKNVSQKKKSIYLFNSSPV